MDAETTGSSCCGMYSHTTRLAEIYLWQTALFAGVQAQLLGGLPDPADHPTASDTAVRFFAYTGLALNLGATLSSILLLVAVASLPTAARYIYMKCDHGYPRKVFDNDSTHIVELNHHLREHGEPYALRAFGIAKGWNIMLRHSVFGFLGGCICTFCHIGINVWLSESTVVAAIVMPGIIVGFVPPVVVFLFYMDSRRCDECAEEKNERYIYLFLRAQRLTVPFLYKGILRHDLPANVTHWKV
jgi:hypothetical protein